MDWTQTITIIGTVITLICFMSGLMIFLFTKLDNDIKTVNSNVESLGRRLDGHATRIDQLYTMFCDLVRKK